MRFERRTVVVTGAAGNLGRSVAEAFAAEGANLALLDLRMAELEEIWDGRDNVGFHEVDLLDAGAAESAMAEVDARFGSLDVLCNIAGGFHMGEPVHELTDDAWRRLLDLNVTTLLNAVRGAVPRMLAGGGGRIVNVGANAARSGVAQMGAYTAAKSTVIRFTEAMAGELRTQGINVNCVLPSIIDTPENRDAMPGADPAKWVAPQDLAKVILFLASDDAGAIHGAALPVVGLS